ncbi:MAG TPA: SCO family protein [Hyphomicrobiales bacterium]|nr:SCO family protein [Hyphomicrobiales bacterium]
MARIIIYSALALFLVFTGYRMLNEGRPSLGTLRDMASAPFTPKQTHPFTLTDHNGQKVSDKSFRGQFLLVFFGYTHCPDVCPTGLLVMSQAMDLLGADAARVTPLFITVDPARDGPEQLKDYVANFHQRLVGLTGSEAQIEDAAKAYNARYVRLDSEDGDKENYFMGHTATTYLTGPDGVALTSFGHETSPEDMAAEIRKFL